MENVATGSGIVLLRMNGRTGKPGAMNGYDVKPPKSQARRHR